MKRGAGVCTCVESYWTYGGMDGEKRRGEVYMCLLYAHLAREVYRPVCAGKKESGGLHTPWVNDLKRNNERAPWRGR